MAQRKEKPFLKSIFSDPASTDWSWARIACSVVIALAFTLLAFVTVKTGKIPERTSELLTGAAAIAGLIYGSTKVANAISTRSEDK